MPTSTRRVYGGGGYSYGLRSYFVGAGANPPGTVQPPGTVGPPYTPGSGLPVPPTSSGPGYAGNEVGLNRWDPTLQKWVLDPRDPDAQRLVAAHPNMYVIGAGAPAAGGAPGAAPGGVGNQLITGAPGMPTGAHVVMIGGVPVSLSDAAYAAWLKANPNAGSQAYAAPTSVVSGPSAPTYMNPMPVPPDIYRPPQTPDQPRPITSPPSVSLPWGPDIWQGLPPEYQNPVPLPIGGDRFPRTSPISGGLPPDIWQGLPPDLRGPVPLPIGGQKTLPSLPPQSLPPPAPPDAWMGLPQPIDPWAGLPIDRLNPTSPFTGR